MNDARPFVACLLILSGTVAGVVGAAQEDGKSRAAIPAAQRAEQTADGVSLAEDEAPSPPSMRTDPALGEIIKRSLSVNYILRYERETTLVQVMIQSMRPPTGMAFDLSLRAGEEIWPLGPVAWSADGAAWWAFDTDLPEAIETADIVLKPSALAAVKLKREPRHRHDLFALKEIWDGPAIVLEGIRIRTQEIRMIGIPAPTPETAREEAMEQLDLNDPVAQRLKREGDVVRARAELLKAVQERPNDVQARYNLGCLAMADSDWAEAMKRFVEARQLEPPSPLRPRIQRQLRHLCAMFLDRAEKDETAAMCALGTAYERGWAVKQDAQAAKRWYRRL